MVDVTVNKSVENPNLTAEQWDLYVFDNKLTQRCSRAAERLNETFTNSVNSGMDRNATRSEVNKVQSLFSNAGADDTEPHSVLEGLLDQVFGKE